MFNLGSKEILIVAVIILFLFGSQKLTEWAKGLGDAGRELKKAKKEFNSALDETNEDIKRTLDLNGEVKNSDKLSQEDKPDTKELERFENLDENLDSKYKAKES